MIENAKIDKVTLGYEEGWFTCWLFLDYGGSCQGFGGYGLGPQWGIQFIQEVLKTVGVDKWEELKGKYVRVDSEGVASSKKISRIGNIIKDDWFSPSELAKKLGVEK